MKTLPQVGRRDFVKLMGTAGLMAAAGATIAKAADGSKAQAGAAADAKPLIDGTPAVFAPTENSAVVVWTVSGAARGWVEYGTDPKKLNMRSGGDALGYTPHDDRVLKVRLTGLAAGTRYWWRAASLALAPGSAKAGSSNPPPEPPPVYTDVYSFATLSSSATETTFVQWNDTHENLETIKRLSALTAGAGVKQPDFLVWNGDITQRNNNEAHLIPTTYVHPAGVVDLAKGPPIFLTQGNHDVRGVWANKVIDYTDYPDTHEGGVARSYYAFRSGPLGAIVLNTGEDKPDRHPSFRGLVAFEPLIEEQARWLEKIIERPEMKNAPVKVVFCHIPLRWTDERVQDYYAKPAGFDRYSKRGRDAWHASLVKWGVRVVISGHVHRWKHIPPSSEFPYAQITGSGPETNSARLIRGHVTAKGIKLTTYDMNGHEADSVSF